VDAVNGGHIHVLAVLNVFKSLSELVTMLSICLVYIDVLCNGCDLIDYVINSNI
jgi:hypothetical protein